MSGKKGLIVGLQLTCVGLAVIASPIAAKNVMLLMGWTYFGTVIAMIIAACVVSSVISYFVHKYVKD